MPNEFSRPEDQAMLEDREAAGLWKAITLSKEIGESSREIDLSVILELHAKMLSEAMPEIAGRFRVAGEDVKPLVCIEPPPGSIVREQIHEFGKDLIFKIQHVVVRPDPKHKKKYKLWVESVFEVAAWTQHKLVAIHPFCEGNGRVARLMTNIILRRFNMPTTDVKIESDNKDNYLNGLCQIDKHSDYEPLRKMLLKGSIATLNKEKEKRQNKQSAS